MVELRLQGHSLEEIAAATQRCERTVRRALEQVKERLEQRYHEFLV
jgi:DNA-directed RNA polymerase specialized sigma24 family protein